MRVLIFALAVALPTASFAASAGQPEPVVIQRTAPVYPPAAEAAEIEGTGTAEAVFGPDGVVTSVRALAETPEGSGFAAAMAEALKSFRFAPSPAGGVFQTTGKFQLEDPPLPPLPPPANAADVQPQLPPDFPEGLSGAYVVLHIAIDVRGQVSGAEVVEENPPGYGLDRAAIEVARLWQFRPEQTGTYQVKIRFAFK